MYSPDRTRGVESRRRTLSDSSIFEGAPKWPLQVGNHSGKICPLHSRAISVSQNSVRVLAGHKEIVHFDGFERGKGHEGLYEIKAFL